MHRRLLLSALACWPAARVLAQDEVAPRPRQKISAAQLYEALSSRFPVRIGVAGLLELRVSAPRLHLAPARNKLGAGLVVEVGGAQAQRLPAGELDVVFALRYEAADQTVRAHHPDVLDLRWPGMGPEPLQTLKGLLPAMTREMGEIVVHRFSARELALPDTMGFQPQDFQVVEDGVVVLFGPKARS